MIVRAVVISCVALLAACASQRATPPSPTARSAGPSPSTGTAAAGPRETVGSASSAPAESVPEAEAKPEPEPKAKPTPETKPETKHPPKPETKPKREPKAKIEPKAVPEAKPKPEPKPKSEPKPSAEPTPSAQPQPKPAATASAPAAAPKPAPLDLKSLEARLKETDAIGLLTKLSLKNQVDDLVGEFRAYHQGERPPTLAQLRPAFDLLLMKVLSLLQDKDPRLAHDVGASRDAIWAVLNDPRKLAEFS